jgi:acyl-CoA synthetase (NDP forming)
MGFYNFADGVWVCGFDTRDNHPRGGNVTLISQSGSGMSGIIDCEERIDFNLAVSTGQEMAVGIADYMDFAIGELDTRVIGLFLETTRDPEALVAALEKANARGIPFVAIKDGRTEFAARMAQSHSGAMAGEDAAWEAMIDRYGVQRALDVDELVTALIMFAQPHPVASGGLVALHDSGGERQLLIDLADRVDAPLTELAADTVARLEQQLDPGLPAVNPLDAWGTGGADFDTEMADCLATLMSDPGAAMGAVVHARGPKSIIYPEYLQYLRTGHAASGKPAFLVANRQGSGSDPQVVAATREGFPVLDGLRPFLFGVKALTGQRDFQQRQVSPPEAPEPARLARARQCLDQGIADEFAAAELLRDLGLPMNPARLCHSEPEALAAAAELGYPLVLKTARPGLAHKTEKRGVHLDLHTAAAVQAAWHDLAERLGPAVLVASMVQQPGVEMALGMIHDAQFGPLVMMGFGGVRLEAMRDVVYAIPPFDAATAQRRLAGLKQYALFRHDRGAGLPRLQEYCEAAAVFSSIVAALADNIDEIDINPIIVHAQGCVAVDALVVPAGAMETRNTQRKAS